MSKRNAKSQFADRMEGRIRRDARKAAARAKRYFVESNHLYSL